MLHNIHQNVNLLRSSAVLCICQPIFFTFVLRADLQYLNVDYPHMLN